MKPKKRKQRKTVLPKEIATLLNREIVNKCSCGEKVLPHERQELAINPKTDKWMRTCEDCLAARKRGHKMKLEA